MEVLEIQGFEINLEVVDNMVYFYSLPKKATTRKLSEVFSDIARNI